MAQKRDSETDMSSCGTCYTDSECPFRYPCGHTLCDDSCFTQQFQESDETFSVMRLGCRKKRRVDAVNGEDEYLSVKIRQRKKNDAADKTYDNGKVS